MDIYEIRKRNLIELIGNRRKNACAEQWGMSPAHLSQILSDKTAKNLGDEVARRIESTEGLPLGWFDSQRSPGVGSYEVCDNQSEYRVTRKAPESAADLVTQMLAKHGKNLSDDIRQKIAEVVRDTADEISSSKVVQSEFSSITARPGEILIRQYDVHASMGLGHIPGEYNEVIRNLIIREDVLREKGVTYTSAESLAMITGWGQSMEGTINDKDPVIVDRGVNEFVGDGIYVITWHDMLYIKRLQVIDAERFLLVSDNLNIRDQEARIEDVTVHAKVLLIWNSRRA
ncbi:S24 family peptidase [Pseudomonas sp. LJDD11]|uniref:S24 family peptidase n=1 Tax=Pseudomonas sp. LJDD11 TaxID=2931984 RepID=UPI00211C449C|nr:S24 family peptidase [Pseudomonas sp. LJDD11]MCQ9423355.1 S24 family peptidase [Pseudomonas sp. LJDD11]